MRKWGPKLLFVTAGLLACYVSITATLYWAMCQTPDKFGRFMTYVPMPMMLVLPFETCGCARAPGKYRQAALRRISACRH